MAFENDEALARSQQRFGAEKDDPGIILIDDTARRFDVAGYCITRGAVLKKHLEFLLTGLQDKLPACPTETAIENG
jgi:hypothetical protein